MSAESNVSPPRIVVLGSLNMDFVIHADRLPVAGESLPCESFETALGGKGANQAVAVCRSGGSVALIGQVGEDGCGDQLLEALQVEGLDVQHVRRDAQTSTGAAFIVIEPSGQNRILVVAGANLTYTPDDLQQVASVIEAADMLVLQLEMDLAVVREAIELAHAASVPILLNPGPAPADPLPRELLSKVRCLTPNEIEAEALTGMRVTDPSSARAAATALLEIGAQSAVITLGEQGAVGIDEQGAAIHVPAHQVEARDTVAAGDTFTGALAVRLTEGATLESAMGFATAASAICVTRDGSLASVPLRQEVEALLAGHQTVGSSRN